jgi:hypothetical protein
MGPDPFRQLPPGALHLAPPHGDHRCGDGEQPGDSLPKLFPKPYDLQADYRIFDEPEATTDNLNARRRQVVHTCTKSCLMTSLLRGGQGGSMSQPRSARYPGTYAVHA